MSVWKKWQSPATQASYEEVTLKAFQIYEIKALLEKKLPNQDDYFDKLHWTRILTVEYDQMADLRSTFQDLAKEKRREVHQGFMDDEDLLEKRCKLEQQEFNTLTSYLPNLQKLDINYSDHRGVYRAFLRDLYSTFYLKRIG